MSISETTSFVWGGMSDLNLVDQYPQSLFESKLSKETGLPGLRGKWPLKCGYTINVPDISAFI